MLNETKRYEYMLYTGEGKRVHRVLGGIELARAEHKAHSIRMGAMGISTTNLVFDSELLPDLDPEIIKILKTDPTHDENIMYPRSADKIYEQNPVDPRQSSVTRSTSSGGKDNYNTYSIDQWERFGISQGVLDLPVYNPVNKEHDDKRRAEHDTFLHANNVRSSTMSVIDQLPFWIHDLERWKNGFNPVKYRRSIHQLKKAAKTAVHGADRINRAGEVITRKLRIKRRQPRVQTQSIRY